MSGGTTSGARPPSEERVLRAAARRIAIQTTALFAAALILLGAFATGFILDGQRRSADDQLHQALADRDSVADPPSGIVIYQQGPDGRVESSPTLQGRPLSPRDFASVLGGGPAVIREVHTPRREYRVLTGRRGDTVVQVGLELAEQGRERVRLATALGLAGAFGLALAGGVGWVIARRSIAPLGLALARQQRFVADASHELRTPLTQVHTRAQMIARRLHRLPDAGTLPEDADRLVAGTRQLGEIVDEMLMAAQLRAQSPRTHAVDLNTLAAEVVDADRERAEAAEVTVRAVPSDEPAVVDGVPSGLRRVLVSLLDNALGHTPPGGTVTVGVARSGAAVRVTVADTGVGLGAGDPEALFARFARGSHGSGRRYGIGLALVREIVDAHRGTITADSPGTGGAVFTVTLPAADPKLREP